MKRRSVIMPPIELPMKCAVTGRLPPRRDGPAQPVPWTTVPFCTIVIL
ncbi:hypothetical protein [Streptomyces sp. NBC_01578]